MFYSLVKCYSSFLSINIHMSCIVDSSKVKCNVILTQTLGVAFHRQTVNMFLQMLMPHFRGRTTAWYKTWDGRKAKLMPRREGHMLYKILEETETRNNHPEQETHDWACCAGKGMFNMHKICFEHKILLNRHNWSSSLSYLKNLLEVAANNWFNKLHFVTEGS